jgi:hypothetical protein
VRIAGLYPGIDLVFRFSGRVLEYDFELAAGADPQLIRMRWQAVEPRLGATGDLEFSGAALLQKRPVAYQWGESGKRPVACHYRLEGAGLVVLGLGAYDRSRPLTIDPELSFGTGFGGQGFDAVYAMAVDSSGGVYIAGETDSTSLSASGLRSSRDAFVAKLNSAGTGLAYLTFLGSTGQDAAWGLAVDSSGNAYVTGTSTSSGFPTTTGVVYPSRAGAEDAFVAKLDSAGTLVWGTYLGSAGSDQAYAIAVDASSRPVVVGSTNSTGYPVTAGSYQTSHAGGTSDCFVTRLAADGKSLSYSTFLGGAGLDVCRGAAVDSTGAAYAAGTTYSAAFPRQSSYSVTGGNADAFAVKLNAAGTALVYSVVWGGRSVEEANAIAVDSSGAAYVAGGTASSNFPVTTSAYQTAFKGSYDAYVTKIAADGNSLVYSTLLGGSGADTALAVAVDSAGLAAVSGYTTSTDFPTASALSSAWKGSFDAFAAVVGSAGSTLVFASYFGGTADDRGFAVGARAGGTVLVAGTSSSRDMSPSVTASSAANGYDAFVLQVDGTYGGGLLFVPVDPCRVLDTRVASTVGLGKPVMESATERSFPIVSSSCGLPSTAKAYSLNVTVVPQLGVLGYLSIFPTGQTRPWVSTLNSDNRVVANAAIVPAGTNGAVSVYVSHKSEVIIDVNGYFIDSTSTSGLAYFPVTPCRVADTRNASGSFGGPVIAGDAYRTFPVSTSACLPQDLVPSAYSLTLTAMPTGPLWFLTVWPNGKTKPWVSTLNDGPGVTTANMTLVPSGTGGSVNVYVTNQSHVAVDTAGYFASPSRSGALRFYPLSPCRVLDTRDPTGTFGGPYIGGGQSRDFPIPSSSCGVPARARA